MIPCPSLGAAGSPFGPAAQAENWCSSRINGLDFPGGVLARLVVTEGAVIGIAGSLAGAGLGLAAAAGFAWQLPAGLFASAAAAAAVGVLVTAAAALLPARMIRRLPAAQLLAQE